MRLYQGYWAKSQVSDNTAVERSTVALQIVPIHPFARGRASHRRARSSHPTTAIMKVFSLPFSFSAALLLLIAGCATKPASSVFGPSAPKAATASKTPAAAVPTVVVPPPPPTAPGSQHTTPSGLSYQVLASGPAGGRHPTRTDSVTVHYRGTLRSGTVFDSSYDRGAPATFGVSQVIPGWTEALQLMKPGDKWILQIPFNLAYGAQGQPPKIPPFSDLTFQVELLQISGGM